MRQEPLEETLDRLARFGYESIELSGEPMRYDTKKALHLLTFMRRLASGAATDEDYSRIGRQTAEYLMPLIS